MSTPTPELTSYKGNCHCGAVRFTLKIPSLTEHEVISCDCSICTRNGYLMVYPERQNTTLETGADNLTEFRFTNESPAVHKFCSICGSSVLVDVSMPGYDVLGLNVGTNTFVAELIY